MVVYCGMQTPSEEQVPMEVFQRVLAENAEMKARLAWFERQIFGAKSERFVPDIPGQLPLNFGTAATPEILETVLAEQEAKRQVAAHERSVSKPNQNHQGRTELPGHLPRVEEVIEPEGELEDLKRIGEDVTEVLEYEVGKMWVRRIVRPRYVRPQAVQEQLEQLAEESGEPLPPSVIQAPAPDRPFPRYKAGVSMMVYLLIAKFVDHLPLYRISKQFARQGVKIPDSTLGQWTQAAADALEVLYDAYEKLIFKTPYLQMDETRLKVLQEGQKGKCHLGWLWAVFDPVNKRPFFFYQKGRDHQGPKKKLEHFAGTLQCDGYDVYETLNTKLTGLTLLNCLAHIRRKFFEARDNDRKRADEALTIIGALYAIEEQARTQQLDHQQRLQLRLKKAKPIADAFGEWINEQYAQVLPQSKIGKAFAYAINRWVNMPLYLTDGQLEIDNNLVENIIRPVAIGRKNYLFAGSHDAAKRSAILYTFFAACKHQDINPEQWLNDVLNRIHLQPINKIEELFPHNWKTQSRD
jgi:transposase